MVLCISFFYIDLGLIVLGERICNPFFHILIENAQFVSYLNAKQVSRIKSLDALSRYWNINGKI